MGDRAQVLIEDTGVYLYTHWSGCQLNRDVAYALDSEAGRGRWNDEEYLTRIIFDVMKGDDTTGETGFGIGTTVAGDNEHPLVIVNCAKGTVTLEDRGGFVGDDALTGSWTFEEFIVEVLGKEG
jgi:hypothetical protein